MNPRDEIRTIAEKAKADIAAIVEREAAGMSPPAQAQRALAVVRTKIDEARMWAMEALP